MNNALHFPNIRYNLISVFVFEKVGVKVSFKGYKIVVTKNGVFVGKGHCCGDLFIINVLDTIINNKVSTSTCIVNSNSVNLWHGIRTHEFFLKKMKVIGLLSNIN